jgi:beta-phosphoglucomutase-like phosphatase (HAD superfamily)
VIRLRGNANALNRAVQQNENRLEKLLKQSAPEEATTDETLPASTGIADLLAFARSGGMAMGSVAAVASMSRQQRRAAERQAEKARTREEEEKVRLAQRAAARMAAHGEDMRLTA